MSLQAWSKTAQLREKYLKNSQGQMRKTEFPELPHQELRESGLEGLFLTLLEATSLVSYSQNVYFDGEVKAVIQIKCACS